MAITLCHEHANYTDHSSPRFCKNARSHFLWVNTQSWNGYIIMLRMFCFLENWQIVFQSVWTILYPCHLIDIFTDIWYGLLNLTISVCTQWYAVVFLSLLLANNDDEDIFTPFCHLHIFFGKCLFRDFVQFLKTNSGISFLTKL